MSNAALDEMGCDCCWLIFSGSDEKAWCQCVPCHFALGEVKK